MYWYYCSQEILKINFSNVYDVHPISAVELSTLADLTQSYRLYGV